MNRNENKSAKIEPTPVDDVRRVRERLSREAGGDVHTLVQQSRKAAAKFHRKLGLKSVQRSTPMGIR